MTNEWPYFASIDSLIVEDEREDDDEKFQELVESIQVLGLLQPLVVSGAEDGKMKVVCGRRRFRAMKALGYQSVPVVANSMDGVRQEMAMLSENLHRLPLGRAESDKAVARYMELYELLHPGTIERARQRRQAGLARERATPDQVELLKQPKVQTPVIAAAKSFGVSTGTVQKAIKRVESFTDSQRKVLDDAEVPVQKVDYLAKQDPEVVKEVANLIACDVEFDDAMRDVFRARGMIYTGVDGTAEVLDVRLGKLSTRKGIADPEAFDNDAKLAWALADAIKDFKKKINWNYIKEVSGKNPCGLYFRRLALLVDSPDPRYWVPCRCQATGSDSTGCALCRGGGYQIGA